MANLKLSQLPAATALTGDETLPVVQGGQTRRSTAAAVADLRKGTWQAPALVAPWANYGDAFAAAAYRKDGGRVQLRGLVKAGAGGTVIFSLPVGFRPPAQQIYMVASDSSVPARVDVKTNGEVLVSLPGAGTLGWLSLDNVGFFIDP
ncbi:MULTISPECIES: hypothetical protein [Lysobacter]|uniref:hypothetical protein n=1 Tax=Lysobacter TaxID=68 RepID=UPI001F421556|nr:MULTISPECIES: hypothetical protein [Lysobacter]UJB19298.1 hypothetical protein L1A79_23785 [Lysobacter capsici]UJQ26977.1 hypothetical protein L2D09_16100 [Lysobacter gummosus]